MTGVAIKASGSEAASPTRASPTSTPSRTPARAAGVWLWGCSATLTYGCSDFAQRRADLGGILSAALGKVSLAAAASAQDCAGTLDEVSGGDALFAGSLRGRDDDHRAPLRHTCHRNCGCS